MPSDLPSTIERMETASDTQTCVNCLHASLPDEDGYIECKRFPPELFLVNNRIVQYRPRMSKTDVCGMHEPNCE